MMYDISHLQWIALRGDQTETFQNNWIMVIDKLSASSHWLKI